MDRSLLAPRTLGLLLSLALLTPAGLGARAWAQKADKVKFETVDYVELQGTFYPSPKGKRAPTVLLLHKIGGNSHQDGWDNLAQTLNDKGYSVLSFDFRGHGASTTVEREFWNFAINKNFVRGFNPAKPKESISHKDFLPGYIPHLANDIAAARAFLDRRNDAGDCNSGALILIGAEEGATLGALWMATEWNRNRVTSSPPYHPILNPLKWDNTPEGRDLYCGIWLSLSPTLGGRNYGTSLRSWLQITGKDKKVPMVFVHGADDEKGENTADYYLKALKGTDADALKLTNKWGIKKTKLTGSALLNKALDTEDWLVNTYIAALVDKQAPNDWARRDFEMSGYIWIFNTLRVPIEAKGEKEKTLRLLPLAQFGVTQ